MKISTYTLTQMKVLFFLFGILILLPFSSKSQQECLEQKFEDNCAQQLTTIFDDYIYLKSRPFSAQENVDVNFEVTLKRNVLYIFNVCEKQGKNSMVLKLFDSQNKIVSTSINAKTKGNDKILTFQPKETGKYYISSLFERKEDKCCLIMFGMVRKNIKNYIHP